MQHFHLPDSSLYYQQQSQIVTLAQTYRNCMVMK